MAEEKGSEKIETGDPAVDSKAFRRCLSNFSTGVTIITAKYKDQFVGMTANSFSSLSLDPPLILWSIRKDSSNYEAFLKSSHFAVHFLSVDQVELSNKFAKSGNDKFDGIECVAGTFGSPVITGVNSLLECELSSMHEGGDHMIIVGRVRRFSNFNTKPLLFTQGRYAISSDHPTLALKAYPSTAAEGIDEPALTILLFRAYHNVLRNFDAFRKAEGFSLAEGRVLVSLYQNGPMDLKSIAEDMYLGERDAEDAIQSLQERKLAEQRPNGRYALTSFGCKRREAVRVRAAEFEASQVAEIPRSEFEMGKAFLRRLIDSNQPS
jgi:4-hydroxyphenylacetate 3-hydroxylase, reductase component